MQLFSGIAQFNKTGIWHQKRTLYDKSLNEIQALQIIIKDAFQRWQVTVKATFQNTWCLTDVDINRTTTDWINHYTLEHESMKVFPFAQTLFRWDSLNFWFYQHQEQCVNPHTYFYLSSNLDILYGVFWALTVIIIQQHGLHDDTSWHIIGIRQRWSSINIITTIEELLNRTHVVNKLRIGKSFSVNSSK